MCVCVSLASTLATHLNNSLITAIMTAQLPRRGARGQEATASVTSHHCASSPGHGHSWASSPLVVFRKGLRRARSTAAAHPMLPLLPTAAGGRRCFSAFPADTQYLVWVFFRHSCACVTTCLIFPSSDLNVLNSLSQGKDLLLHRAGFLFSG